MTKIPHIDRFHTIHSKASVALDELQREARNLVGQALESYDRLKLYCQQQALTIAELEAEVRDLRAQLALRVEPETIEMAAAHTITRTFTPEEIAESMRTDVDAPRIPAGGIPVVNESLSSTLKAFFGGK
jgi:hypothetical protein